MATLPISPPVSPTKPLAYHRRLPSDVLRPNPHPYPVKTTSTGILSHSNSATKGNSPYQFYIPQSPASPVKESQHSQNGDKERRGGRHRYSKSLNSKTNPTPLLVPDGFASAPGFRERSGSSSSLSSVEPGTADIFGDLASNTIALGRRKCKAGTTPSIPAIFEASISSSGSVPDSGDKRRGRTYRTMGRTSGGKVRGLVASFERSASRSGDEDEDGDTDAHVLQDSDHRRTRYRSGSEANDHSAGSSSSYSSASPGPSRSRGSEPILESYIYKPQEHSTPGRNEDQPRELEPTIEQLPASFAYSNPLPISRNPTVNIETVKLRDAVVDAGPVYPPAIAVAAASTFDAPFSLPVASPRSSLANARIHATENGEEEELTVERLLALAGMRGRDAAGGFDARGRDAGCTIKRVEEAAIEAGSGVVATGTIVNGTGRRSTGVKSAKVLAEKDEEKRRLKEVLLPVGGNDRLKGKEEALLGEAQPRRSTTDRQLVFEQEMSETRGVVRALSARVASVEARIGEMERAAGDLKVRGRKLMGGNEAGEGKDKEEVKDGVDEDGRTWSEYDAFGRRWPMRSVVGVTRAVVHGALDVVCTTLARVVPLPFSFSSQALSSATSASESLTSETDSATQAREVSKTRASNAGTPMWYKRSWTYYMLFLGLGTCAFVLREVSRRGLLLRGPMRLTRHASVIPETFAL